MLPNLIYKAQSSEGERDIRLKAFKQLAWSHVSGVAEPKENPALLTSRCMLLLFPSVAKLASVLLSNLNLNVLFRILQLNYTGPTSFIPSSSADHRIEPTFDQFLHTPSMLTSSSGAPIKSELRQKPDPHRASLSLRGCFPSRSVIPSTRFLSFLWLPSL